ncbi:hypothetical protein E5673_16795 [Sphingomonas sp. PAMC26645]|uniref:hypothetical protein n=1 Tax=Sphingomonas sp. PAMC26645 TaxID=2565555 RepID=UPI00109D978F|nr:hypothetical protein [Sphingomonas sp. PAMC26645]QCB43683.1 hypothetical protein E5673_16795 [Sphingomonas sp. PAMC26645]
MIDHDEAADLAAFMLAFRRSRTEELPSSLFGEPSWDFLLELFIADARSVRMTGRDISELHRIPAAVASRWLLHLTAEGLIVGDGTGDLDDPLTLSGAAIGKMERLLYKASMLKHRVSE